MFWLKLIRDFISILREGQTPPQVAGGFALGSIIGFFPFFTLQTLVVWLIILILNVNLSAALVALTVFSLIAYLLDPLFHWLGYLLLVQVDALRGLWTLMYNAPVAPLTRFNNTVVMGSFVLGIVLAFLIYFGMKSFVIAYRKHLHARVEQWKIYQVIKKSALLQWYEKIRSLKPGV
jgi:uncharacterized protein (TIGR03546 family)